VGAAPEDPAGAGVAGTDRAGLNDAPRPGRPCTITDAQVEMVITRTLGERGPGDDTHWSTRSLASETGTSQTAVRIWWAFGLKPHLVQT
jgi:hypothetical protein